VSEPKHGPGSARRFPPLRQWALDISPLRESVPYRALWLGQIVSLMGTHMRILAVSFQIFQLTGSTVAVGLVGLVEIVPLIAFSIIGGAAADRADRRKLMAVMQVGLLLTSLGLAWVSVQSRPSVLAIYALSAIGAVFQSADRPARSAILPSLVKKEHIPAALALRQVVFQLTMIVGPFLGGLLIAVFADEVTWVYVVDAFSFIAALVALHWVPSSKPERLEEQTSWESIREGLAFSFRTPLIFSILAIDLIAMIFGMPRAAFPELAEKTLGLGPAGLGLLYAAPSAGALVAALASGWVKNISAQGKGVIIAVLVWGGAMALAGLSVFSVALVLFFLALAGAADVISAIFRGTILNQNTPDALLGRVNSVNLMVVTGGPRLGDVEAGLAAGVFGAPGSVVFGGLACIAGTGVLLWRVPALNRYRARRLPGDGTERTAG
jgi:MFS family permease